VPIGSTGQEFGPEGGAGGGGGSGTVTSVSVASANGLAGTVAHPTTAAAITLSTTVTGLLKGNGTAIEEATPGTDYIAGPLTGDVTTSGNAATLVGTANVIAVVTAILLALGISFGSGNPNTNTAGGSQAGTLNEVYFNATASGQDDWAWRCSTGGAAGTAVWVGKL
jgi:hypothetical protein